MYAVDVSRTRKPTAEIPPTRIPPTRRPPGAPVEAGVILSRPLTPRELADYLQVSLSTVARLYRSGDIPSIRVGTQVRFLPHRVVAVLESRSAREK